jgi:DNA-binding NarL/FixJ family response regulator
MTPMHRPSPTLPGIWLVEDNPIFATSVRRVIESFDDMECTGCFQSVEQAFAALQDGQSPQVILLDVQLPGLDGISALATFRAQSPGARVIILTVFDDADKIFRAVCAGASGYVLKSAGIDAIGDAIRQVIQGGAPMTPAVARKVLDAFAAIDPEPSGENDYNLTPREREILRLLADGLVKKEIGEAIGISAHTVSTHLQRVYEKLHVTTNTGAVAKALRERLI